ncbi:MAG: helix-hairpin-helix domain-containing protein [Evtepia sp.]
MPKISVSEKIMLLLTLICILLMIGRAIYPRMEVSVADPAGMVPEKIEAVEAPGILEGERIDLNTAGLSDLDRLPGVGEKRAESILRYREEHGGFHSVEELLEIKGIGEKRLEEMRAYVTVGEEKRDAENFGGG